MVSRAFTLRVSVLENCQLRCSYCLPNNGHFAVHKRGWLSLDQYAIIAQSFAQLPVHKIRFTGGEPLLRPNLPDIVGLFAQNMPKTHLALTTNGLLYEAHALKLHEAGLDSITFHLDTLREARYEKIMGRGCVAQVLAAIKMAQPLVQNCKLNVVVQRGKNDDEIVDFIHFGHEQKIAVRFIELMNTGSAQHYVAQHFMSGAEILAHIAQHFSIEPVERETTASPAERYSIKELAGHFGLIASDTRAFCQACDRVRLSADGRLRTCLYEQEGLHLGLTQEKSPTPREVLAKIEQKIANKTSFHPSQNKARRIFSMSQTGG